MSIFNNKFSCQNLPILPSSLKVKKQVLLFMTFFFFCSYLGFGQTFSGTTGPIDDNNCPTTNDFTTSVSGVGVLGTTNFFNEVVINITHTYTGDLDLTLTAPGGTPSVLLSSGNGGGGNNYTDTHFRLDAILPIGAGSPPFTGDFRSEESLALFDGINADGIWTLELCDDAGADVGTVDSWEITFGTEPVEPFICTNPINPSPSCNNFNVVVVLDESGSIDDATEAQVEAASIALANALIDTGAEMAFVEFAESGDVPTYGGFSGWNVVDQDYIDGLNNPSTGLVVQYGDNSNTTGPFTNWEDALNKVLELNLVQVADLVLFMTDGSPTAYINDLDGTIDSSGGTSTALGNALDESCDVKQMGSHIFMLGVGTGIEANNLAEISGPILDDGPADPTLTVLSSDYGLISAGDITQCFLDIAQSGCNNNLALEKSVYAGHDGGTNCNGEESIPNPSDSKVTYCFTVSNDGDQVISNLDFSDSDIGIDASDLTPAFQTSIASGQSITYYYEMTFSNEQIFPFVNTAEVTGETPAGDPLSDSNSAEVTESLCEFPNLTTENISICPGNKTTIDLSVLVTSNGTVSFHTSQLDADNNNNPLLNINVNPSSDTTYYVRSEVAENCYVTDIIIISVTEIPEEPILECWQSATINEQTCQWEITGEQPVEPETACYETATFNDQLCQWEITGEQPIEPNTACYETAIFNSQTCLWEVSGEQPIEPETECYELATFNRQQCQWVVRGIQPIEPETECYETAIFNSEVCQWTIVGVQPLRPRTSCYELATFNNETCQWVVTGEQPEEPDTACYEAAIFNSQTCLWEVSGEQPLEPETECYETANFNNKICQWEVTGEQPEEPETACYETATYNPKICQWVVTGEQPLEPEIACYELATFNDKLCAWEVTGEQPEEPETACYEIATFNLEECQWIINGKQPLEPETACYEMATFNDQECAWEVSGEQPLEPETACYEIASFNDQKCVWEVTGEQPIEPETACYEIATFNNKICQWEVSGEQPLEPETACYQIASFNDQKCVWEINGEQPIEPETACYELAVFNDKICQWEVTGEQPLEPETACYEIAMFNDLLCVWEVTGEQPIQPETLCYEIATFNDQQCEWEVSGEQPIEPETACYEIAVFNDQKCVWVVTGEQPLEPETDCYEIAIFNDKICEWEVFGEQPIEPETACYEITTFNNQLCAWEVTGEQPLEPETACYETATFNPQDCLWEVSGEQPLEPETECYEIAIFNIKECQWEITGEHPIEPKTACYEIATFDLQECEWIVSGEQPIEPETMCYEIATFNDQLCLWEVTGEKPLKPETECYENTVFNYQLCQWDTTGVKPKISADEPICDTDYGTYFVDVYVNIGDVSSSIGNANNNMDGTWTVSDIPINSDVTISTSLDETCSDSIVVESPECNFCVKLEVSHTNVTCSGSENGTITIDFVTEGATVTVNEEIYDPNTLYAPGTYLITAFLEENNDENCLSPEVVTVTEPEELICKLKKSYDGNKIECDDRVNNFLTADVSGGTGSYTYLWSIDDSSYDDLWAIESGDQSQTMTFIPGQGYSIFTVEVFDENGCSTSCQIKVDSTCTEDDFISVSSRFDFEMHPNPTQGNLTIIPNKITDSNVVIELYDLVGTRLIGQEFSKIRDNRINIDLSNLDSQVYFLRVITKDGEKIKKVVVSK